MSPREAADAGELYALRALESGDRAFVVSTWAQNAVADARVPWWAGQRASWLSALRATANALLAGGDTRCVVLCSPTTPGAIMGWACARDGVVLHAYVRPAVRATHLGRSWAERLMAAAKGAARSDEEE